MTSSNFTEDFLFNSSHYAHESSPRIPRLMDRLEIKIIFGIIMCTLCFITTLGNICVIYRYRRTSSVGNLFIISLAIADLIVGSFVMPLASVYAITEIWTMPLFVCQIWLSADYTASTSSILNLLTLSLDRYWSITSPLEYLSKRTKSRALFMISLAWSISLLWVLPIVGWAHFFNNGIRVVPPDKCNTEYDKNIIFKIATAICNFYLPLIAMCSINTKIYLVIRKRYDNPIMDPNGEFNNKIGSQTNRRKSPFDNILLEWLWNFFSCFKSKKRQQQQLHQSQMISNATKTNDVTNQTMLLYKRNSFEKPSQSSTVTKSSRYNNNHLSRNEKGCLQASMNDDEFSVSLSTASNTCNKNAFSILRRQDSQQNHTIKNNPGANKNSFKSASICFNFVNCCGVPKDTSTTSHKVNSNDKSNFQSAANTHSELQMMVKYSKESNLPNGSLATVLHDPKAEKPKTPSFKLSRLNNNSFKSSRRECAGERSVSRMFHERCKLPDNSIRITRLMDSNTLPTPTERPDELNDEDLSRISPIYSKPDKFFEPNLNLIQVLNSTYGAKLDSTSEEPKQIEIGDKELIEPFIDSNNNVIDIRINEDNSSGSSKNLPSPDGPRLGDGESENNNPKSDASSRTTVKKLSNQSNTGSHSKPSFMNSSKNNFKSTLTLESKVNARKGFMNKQEKAFKQLGAIVIGFTLCFLPYFIVFLIVAICEDCVNEDIFTLTVWLGYLNSTINPFLYALSNKKYIRSIRARSIFARRNAKKVRKQKPQSSTNAPFA